MSFNIALSGLNASSTELETTGNNISNASTTGFKKSRAEFGDMYSSGLLNLGATDTGDGVRVQDIRQQFEQGNITSTDNGLDMAINGEGFFVLEDGGERQYSRSGEFGVNEEGFVVNNQGARVQGFQTDGDGEVGDVRGDLEVDASNLQPKRTTNVEADLNLDSREEVLAERFSTYEADGTEMGRVVSEAGADLPAVEADEDNEEGWRYTTPEGDEFFLSTDEGSASSIAATLSEQTGVVVDATTTARISPNDFVADADEDDRVNINGVDYEFGDEDGEDGLADLASRINDNPPAGITVQLDEDSGDLNLISDDGDNIDLAFSGDGNSAMSVQGDDDGATEETLDAGNTALTVNGVLDFTVDDGYELTQEGGTEFLDDPAITSDITNAFDPDDSRTYNHSTSATIYDSLGNSHELNKYFVKEPSTGPNPSNLWSMYAQVDGEDVGPPDPESGEPTQAQFDLRFNSDGTLDETLSDEPLINNWVPKNEDGEPNGADGPDLDGETPIPDPPESSNFAIDMGNTTQVGEEFAVNDLQQDGFATGRLSGLDVTGDGVIQARYTNGESEAIGQVSLANFRNNEGLASVGDNAWVETFESGDAVMSRPNTGPLGSIESSSVEESNVDLSEQLVGLIVAQRDFQANAKTIETSDSITQTIINLR